MTANRPWWTTHEQWCGTHYGDNCDCGAVVPGAELTYEPLPERAEWYHLLADSLVP